MKKYSKLKTALAVAIMSFSMINTVIAADAPIELKGDGIFFIYLFSHLLTTLVFTV